MKHIQIIFTGGTIAMRTNDQGLLVPAVTGEDLTQSIPALRKIAHISSHQFSNIPSSQMSTARVMQLRHEIVEILSHGEIDGVVVVHGTDTMEETAFLLDAASHNIALQNKPVILTGAMRSNDELSADGMANLLDAVSTAAHIDSQNRGVMVVMNKQIHSARYVRKMDTSAVQTFQSPQYMPLGEIMAEEEGGVTYHLPANRYTPNYDVSRETKLPRVDVIEMHADADDLLLKASIAAGAKAVVINAVGAGNVNLELYHGIKEALQKNIGIVIASRSPLGVSSAHYGYDGGGKTLEVAGAVFSHDLPAHKARLLAQLAMANLATHDSVIEALHQTFNPLKRKRA